MGATTPAWAGPVQAEILRHGGRWSPWEPGAGRTDGDCCYLWLFRDNGWTTGYVGATDDIARTYAEHADGRNPATAGSINRNRRRMFAVIGPGEDATAWANRLRHSDEVTLLNR